MKDIKFLKTKTSLPTNLQSVLIGLMLGDGGIYKSSPTGNSRFEMSFGENYQQFAESIGYLFSDYIKTPVKTVNIQGKSKVYVNYRLKTVTLPLFNQYHDLFYVFDTEKRKFIKVVPLNILDLLDSIVLAYLIMSDGNFDKSRNRIRIYTNSYTEDDVRRLASSINTKFGIYVGVLYDRKDQWILTIGAKQLYLLREIVVPHFEKSMLYRIGIT